MGSINNSLTMYVLLKRRGKMSRQELADKLEVNPRQITAYKRGLEDAGVNIINKSGKYGGYSLENDENLFNIVFSSKEKKIYYQGLDILKGQGFPYIKEMEILAEKIFTCEFIKKMNIKTKNHIRFENLKQEKEFHNKIDDAIGSFLKISLEYMNTNRESSIRVVHPYMICNYNGANYLIAYCEQREAIRQFKLVRIKNIELLKEKFKILENFDSENYLSETIGIYKDEIVDLKLKILYPFAQYFKENKRVEKEKIEDFPEKNYLIYTARLEGKTQIKSWILGMGPNCIILEPADFKKEIKQLYEECIKNC